MDKNLNIQITTGTMFRVALVLALFYLVYILRDLVLIILTAVVIASAVEPATKFFAKYRISRLPAVLIVYLAATSVLFGIIYLFLPSLLSEASSFLSELPQYLKSLELENSALWGSLSNPGATIENISSVVSLGDILNNLKDFTSVASSNVFKTASMIFGGVTSFFFIVVLSFYLSVQENGIDNFLRVVTPAKHEDYVIKLWRRGQAKIGRWMQGQLLLVLVIGVLVYLGLTILQIPHAFLLAVIAGLFELIPLFGPVISAVPALGVAFMEGGFALALVVAGLYVIIQQFENHLIYPLVVKKVVGVPALLVILALIAGAKIAGFLGIILAVPAAVVIQELAGDYQYSKKMKFEEEKKEEQKEEEKKMEED